MDGEVSWKGRCRVNLTIMVAPPAFMPSLERLLLPPPNPLPFLTHAGTLRTRR